jgi:hypothetical protein
MKLTSFLEILDGQCRRLRKPAAEQRNEQDMTTLMSARLNKATTAFLAVLVSVVTVWQSVFAVSAGVATSTAPVARKCCGSKHCQCCGQACCAMPTDNRAPVTPAMPPTTSHNEWQALAPSVISVLPLTAPIPNDSSVPTFLLPSMTALPIFQRDCCYLL